MTPLAWLAILLAGVVVLPWDPAIIPGPLLRETTPTPADQPVDAPQYTRRNVAFNCSEETCDAWLFLPKTRAGSPKLPVIVMGHGLGAQKDFGFDQYGQKFAKAGLAVFAFDYRTFGGSTGEPRHWVSPKRHLEDWASAIDFVKSSLGDKVDASKLVLWGTSFAGGHVLVTAAKLKDQVAAVISQVPFLDGRETLKRNIESRGYLSVFRAIAAGMHDTIRSLASYPAAYFPVVGAPGGFAFMQLDEEETRAYFAKHPPKKQGGWRNMAAARLVLEGSKYRPVASIPDITAPVLFVAATRDKLCPVESVRAGAALAKRGELLTVNCNHFSIYSGAMFEAVTDSQLAFIKQATGWSGPASSSSSEEQQQEAAEAAAAAAEEPETS